MPENDLKQYTILFIGETPDLLKVFTGNPNHFKVVVAENGLKALSRLDSGDHFDAIVSEVNLKGINGFELIESIRNQKTHLKLPFILIHHQRDQNLKRKAFESKIDDFYDTKLNADDVYHRITFLNTFKKHFSTEVTPQTKQSEYKIPWMKRLFDILVSSFALLVLSPIMLLAMLAIRLESKGKVYYTSKRVGTGYRIFDFYKFRSMRTDADSMLKDLKHLNQYDEEANAIKSDEPCPKCAQLPEGQKCSPGLFTEGKEICEYWYYEQKKTRSQAAFVKIQNDPRITKVGHFIRNTSIDELPQLINVLKGDMSIVGNRPLPLYEAEMLTSDDWSERFMGPAGITGLWQVELRGKKGKMSEEERKALDNQYARTYSFIGDIKLILRTIPALFQKGNV